METIIEKLKFAVLEYNTEKAISAARDAINFGVDPLKAIEDGLAKGIREMGDKFANGEVFLTELAMAAETMKKALEVLEPELKKMGKERKTLGKVLLGTVSGDIHSIGKSIVAAMLSANGFDVYDIGEDVPAEKFVEKIRELKPDIVGLSALLSTTLLEQKVVIETLKREGLRNNVKVIIGGAPASKKWAEEIGADGYGADANEAVDLVKKLLGCSR